jgi:hypothetical protein
LGRKYSVITRVGCALFPTHNKHDADSKCWVPLQLQNKKSLEIKGTKYCYRLEWNQRLVSYSKFSGIFQNREITENSRKTAFQPDFFPDLMDSFKNSFKKKSDERVLTVIGFEDGEGN